jgi:hypothetical protein
MFVGGAVEDNVGAFFGEDSGDALLVADVGEAGADVSADPALAKLAVDFEEGVFGALDEDQPARTEFHGLATDLGADAAAGAGDEDGFAGEKSLQFGGVEADGLSAEELEYIHRRALLL